MGEASLAVPENSGGALQSPRNDKADRLLELFIRIVAIGVPILYVIGRVYAEGYWSALGLSSGLSAYDVDDYVYLGFYALVIGSANALGISVDQTLLVVLVGGLALSLVTILVILVEHWTTVFFRAGLKKIDERSAEWRRKHHGAIKKFGYPAVVIGIGFYALFYIVAVSLLAALFALVFVNKIGKSSGQQALERFADLEDSKDSIRHSQPIVQYKRGEGGQGEGLLLDCSVYWCFIFEDGRFVAVPYGTVIGVGQSRSTQ